MINTIMTGNAKLGETKKQGARLTSAVFHRKLSASRAARANNQYVHTHRRYADHPPERMRGFGAHRTRNMGGRTSPHDERAPQPALRSIMA